MKDTLRSLLILYKELTEELGKWLKKDKLDEVKNVLDKRQQIINEISNIRYTREELSVIIQELNILQLQKSVDNMMLSKKEEVIQEMQQLLKRRNANKLYSKNLYNNSWFNKKG